MWDPITQFVSVLSKTVQFHVTPALGIKLPAVFVQGWVAAMIHHVLITVALGSDITFSIVEWALSNLVCILFTDATHPFATLNGILLFNATYVTIFAPVILSVGYLDIHLQIHL